MENQPKYMAVKGFSPGTNNDPVSDVENARNKLNIAKNNLNNAESDLDQALKDSFESFKKESKEKIKKNEKLIAEFKVNISASKDDLIAIYKNKVDELERLKAEVKVKLGEYKEDGKDKWESFKLAFNKDMDTLDEALTNFTTILKK